MRIRLFAISVCTCAAILTFTAQPASAQGFVSPLLGYDFGGDSGCPEIRGCENKKLNFGVGLGTFGPILGAEFDLSYAKDFFGTAPGYSSNVLTMMGNLLIGPRIGPVQPYGTGGIGLIKTEVDFAPSALLDSSNNHLGWNIGGGVMIFPAQHVGVRGDIRYFHAFQDLEVLGFPLGDTKLDFGRASAAIVFRF
jgi:opacity protein-like surface antigen